MLHFECPVCQPNLYTVQPYFQPSFVVSAKIRLIRISAEKFVQPAEFKKNPAEGSDMTHSTLSGGALKHTFPGSFQFPPAVNSSAFDSRMSLMALY